MSEFITKIDKFEKARIEKLERLQKIFVNNGGEGNVQDFLEMGAKDPEREEDTNWETMTKEEQQLWLNLHGTGLTDMNVELMEMISEDELG